MMTGKQVEGKGDVDEGCGDMIIAGLGKER